MNVPDTLECVSLEPITAVLFDFAWTTFAPSVEDWVLAAAEDMEVDATPDQGRRIIRRFDERLRETAVDPDHITRDLDPQVHRTAILSILTDIEGVSPAFAASLYEGMVGPRGWMPYRDTASTLERLHELGARIGVVSNIGWDIRKNFAHQGLADLVDAYVLSYEVGYTKPAPKIWAAALAALDVSPSQTLMVGDHPATDGGAVASGIAALVLPMVESPDSERGLQRVLPMVGTGRTR